MARAVQNAGHHVRVIKFGTEDNEYVFEGIHVMQVGPSSKGRLGKETQWKAVRRAIMQQLCKESFDVIHAQHVKSTRASVGLGLPVVATVRDYWPVCFKGTLHRVWQGKNCQNNSWLNCWKCIFRENSAGVKLASFPALVYLKHRVANTVDALQQCDKVICNSRFTYDVTKRAVPENKLVIVHNMIDYNKLQTIVPYRFSKPTVLYVNKINPNKGPQVLVEAMKFLPGMQAVFVSEPGTERDALRQRCEREGIGAVFLDYVSNDEALAMMKGCDVFVIPPLWHEPLGRTHLEGLALGCRIVTTMTGGTGDIIEDEVNGLVFDSTPEHLASQVKRFMSDKALGIRLAENGRKTARERFDQTVILPQALKVYEDVVKA